MARWQVTISGKGIRKDGVEKLAKSLADKYGEGSSIIVSDATPPESRQDRFDAAIGQASEAKSEIEGLKDELQEWFDNLPENFQQGEKGQHLEETISQLDDLIGKFDDIEGESVEFPGMH